MNGLIVVDFEIEYPDGARTYPIWVGSWEVGFACHFLKVMPEEIVLSLDGYKCQVMWVTAEIDHLICELADGISVRINVSDGGRDEPLPLL